MTPEEIMNQHYKNLHGETWITNIYPTDRYRYQRAIVASGLHGQIWVKKNPNSTQWSIHRSTHLLDCWLDHFRKTLDQTK